MSLLGNILFLASHFDQISCVNTNSLKVSDFTMTLT